jgi:hypothetical protein
MIKNDKITPLLETNIRNELVFLQDENEKFNTLIQEIEQQLGVSNIGRTGVDIINNKLALLKEQMEKIFEKIHFIKNFLKDDQGNQTLVSLNKIKTISQNVYSRFEKVNTKFINLVKNNQHDIDMSINRPSTYEGGLTHQMLLQKDGKKTLDLQRLQNLQKEYEKILTSSSILVQISREIKRETEKQEGMVLSIEDSIASLDTNTKAANAELAKRKDQQSSNVSFYAWTAFLLLLIFVIILYILYYKYYNSKSIAD